MSGNTSKTPNIQQQSDIQQQAAELYSYIHEVQYYETDQMGIVHHSNYIRWMEEARLAMLNAMGWNYAKLEASGIISPVLEVQCSYQKSVFYGETAEILVSVEAYNGVKLFLQYQILDSITHELRAKGRSSHCFLDKDTRKPLILKKQRPEFDAALRKNNSVS